MSRQISGLRYAHRYPAKWPPAIPRPRPRGIKALGARYESAFAKSLPTAERGVWWEFIDDNGPGLCQTDFIWINGPDIIIFECKHTWTDEGMAQLIGLYIPVVSRALQRNVTGIQICKHLVPWAGPTAISLEEALANARATGQPTTLHWRGLVPIAPSAKRSEPPFTNQGAFL